MLMMMARSEAARRGYSILAQTCHTGRMKSFEVVVAYATRLLTEIHITKND